MSHLTNMIVGELQPRDSDAIPDEPKSRQKGAGEAATENLRRWLKETPKDTFFDGLIHRDIIGDGKKRGKRGGNLPGDSDARTCL